MREGRGGRRCGSGRRGRCSGLATILRVGLRGSGGGDALAGWHLGEKKGSLKLKRG